MYMDCIANNKHSCQCIGITMLMISIVVQCIGIALLLISIVVQCIEDKHGCAMYRDCITYDQHRCSMLEN